MTTNLRPYIITVESYETGSTDWATYRIKRDNQLIHTMRDCGESEANHMAALLNDAYQAGAKANEADFGTLLRAARSAPDPIMPADTPERLVELAAMRPVRDAETAKAYRRIEGVNPLPIPITSDFSWRAGWYWNAQWDSYHRCTVGWQRLTGGGRPILWSEYTHYLPDSPVVPTVIPTS